MFDYCINRLSAYTSLSIEEKGVLRGVVDKKIKHCRGDNIMLAGSEPKSIHVIYNGWASRYKVLPNGREHIVAYLIPGDMCDVHVTLLKRMDHSIRAETPLTVGVIDGGHVDYIMHCYPNLAKALFWSMLVDESIAREWLVNLAGRSAEVRIANLFCELFLRSKVAGLTSSDTFVMPLNQVKISEAMGLTSVHTNRVIQRLKRDKLIVVNKQNIQIPDFSRLQAFADFNGDYLHMGFS
ncbi:Crp/Fnr family transcriptional regulator [Chromohalobacter canadensis]|uniref:Crp/Fnr family transcriptional regulator n=1 Tax=Chromohalobacter canadensis TaxID=141389 RepID=UPI00240F2305|nr:Crp/Fnr family transcriptional regulator [Chromohalobacter canadensis]